MPRRKPRQLSQKVRIEWPTRRLLKRMKKPRRWRCLRMWKRLPLRKTTTRRAAKTPVCRVVLVALRVTCASAASAVVATVMSVTRPSRRCR
ncbi:Ribonuclease E [Cronobacter turicensis 564]|nr:Ribonuclease E [Cronobacter turicensis 564]